MRIEGNQHGERVGLKIKIIRQLAGINQCAMSKTLGLSQSAYSRIETGETAMTVQQLVEIAQILHINAPALLE